MSFGLPVVINNSSGNRDIVRNGKDGYLFNNSEKRIIKNYGKILDNKILLKSKVESHWIDLKILIGVEL